MSGVCPPKMFQKAKQFHFNLIRKENIQNFPHTLVTESAFEAKEAPTKQELTLVGTE